MGCSEAKPENAYSIKKVKNNIYEVKYTDGSTYIGEIKNGMKSGQGEYLIKRPRKIYEYFLSIRDDFDETYKGNWEKDEMSGIGTYTYKCGSVYNGEWKHGMRNGEGEYELATLLENKKNEYVKMLKYKGNWINNQMEGQGKITFPQGFIYESEFSKNFVTSKGRIITQSGVYYAAENIDAIHDFGRLFIREGQSIPPTYEKFYCICILFDWSVYEGWMDFGKKKTHMALLDSKIDSDNFLSTLKGDGTLYIGEKGYTNCTWSGKFKFEGFGISRINSKEKYKGMFKKGLKNGYGVCIYKSGDIYKGKWNDDLKNGYGTMTYKNGKVFTGYWNNDRKSLGTKTYPNGESFFGTYKSERYRLEFFLGKDKFRQGTYLYNNGDRYEGSFKNKKKIDRGIMIYKDGSTYKGQWTDDKPDGFGIYTSNDGWFYQGQWKNGEKIGIGITSDDPNTLYKYSADPYKLYEYTIYKSPCKYIPPGEEKYSGSYLEGTLKNGNGKCEYANGDVYEGLWDNDKKKGRGKFVWANQQWYDGNWELDEMIGFGVLQMTDGSFYQGGFLYGKYFYEGKLTLADGALISGKWENGILQTDDVSLELNNGDNYRGPIQDLKKHGNGRLHSINGNYTGNLENDIRHGKGKEELMTGEQFTGTWDHGLKQGPGTYQDEFENVYKGIWNMDKKHGEFVITFKTKEVLTIIFENDKPVGKGTLDYSGCKETEDANGESGGILIDDETKQVKWKSSAVKKIFKKTKKIKRYENYFYSEPERCASLVSLFNDQDI
ncbi:hypothetical protein SteCoe_37742 [Stentor coeruleus]|uniref:MORN repeat protein n=1 Tax=Stentor coeruleus TaxID=5963 RepID=A0A1R2AMI9_9CILI|nr:hypothetical protein SteCoe_37742 [Stentor coeruleus]